MTVLAIAVLALGTYVMKASGLLAGSRQLPARAAAVVALLPASLLAALCAVQTFGAGETVALDARVIGVAAAATAIAFRAPFTVVVGAAMVATAATRFWL